MSDQRNTSSIQILAAGFLGFVGVVGLGSLLILHHGGAAVKAPVVAYAPVDADLGMPAPVRAVKPSSLGAPLGAPGAVVSSPLPLLSGAAAVQTPAAAVAARTTPAAAQLVVGRHLDGAASASSSAAAPVASAPKPKALRANAKKPFFAPKLDLAKNQGTTTVHYGVSGRAELMGRAAGPVYNFSGKSLGAAAAMRQVNAARTQLDASEVPADEKEKLDQNLNQVRESADAAP